MVLGGLSEEVIFVQRTEWSEKVEHEEAWERAFQENKAVSRKLLRQAQVQDIGERPLWLKSRKRGIASPSLVMEALQVI